VVSYVLFFFFQAEDGIRDGHVTGVQTCALPILGAAIAYINVVSVPRLRWLLVAVAPAVVGYLAVQILAWYVSSFIVKPNELARERPYIAYNIAFTRQAYGLNQLLPREFPAETTVEA